MAERVGGIYYEVSLDTAKAVRDQREVDAITAKAAGSFNSITAAVKLYAAALAVVKSINAAESMRLLAARVEVAAGSLERGAKAMRSLEDISRRTQTSIEANAGVFSRLNASMLQMGGTQEDTLRLTEMLAKAVKVSGASAAESASAMLQFGQALGSGKLAGDELRSLLENAPYLMRQLAAGLGVPIGALKQLGEDGKLTADVVVNALGKAADQIDADFRKVPRTFGAGVDAMLDAAARANEAFDRLSGVSAAATGAVQGLGAGLDMLADQFRTAAAGQDEFGRNKAVESWSRSATLALSYVADVADVAWQALSVLGRNVAFVFNTLGSQVGGIGAMLAAAARGEFAAAKAIWDEMAEDDKRRRAELDRRDQETLRDRLTAGQRMRQRMEALDSTPEPDRLDRAGRATGTASRLRPAARTQAGGAGGRANRDFLGAADDEFRRRLEQWQERNAEALDRADEEAARTVEEGMRRRTDELNDLLAQRQAEADKAAAERDRSRAFATDILTQGDDVARLEAQLEEKKLLLANYAAQDQENAQLYADARVALEEQTAKRIAEVRAGQAADAARQDAALLLQAGQVMGAMVDMTRAFGDEQSKAYSQLFAASKAFAIAESIIKIQQGIAQAASLPFPGNLGAMATVAAATAGIVSTIKGTNYGGGRQYGGPVTAGSLYRVNEDGRPEMFTAANGAQYMMPTAGGRVTPAGGAGMVVQWRIEVNNTAAGTVATAAVDDSARVVRVAVSAVADQIRERSGEVWGALRSSTNVQGRL